MPPTMETPAAKKTQQPKLPFKTVTMDQQQGLDVLDGDSIYDIYDEEGNRCDPNHVKECLGLTEDDQESKASSVASASDDENKDR